MNTIRILSIAAALVFVAIVASAQNSLSNHVRQNAFLLAAAQWNGPKYCAYPASFGDRRHVDRSSHEVKTAISPRWKLPIGRQTLPYPVR